MFPPAPPMGVFKHGTAQAARRGDIAR